MSKKPSSEIALPEKSNLKTLVNIRFRSLSLLTDYFPITLNNGIEVPGVTGTCPHCNKPIMKAMFRGELRHAPENCFRVTAVGWCLECDILSPFLFHVLPFGPTFIVKTLNGRGWPEAYDHTVLAFEKPKKRRKQRKIVIETDSGGVASFSEKFIIVETANTA